MTETNSTPERRRRAAVMSWVLSMALVVVVALAMPATASSGSQWAKAYCTALEKYTAAYDKAGAAAREFSGQTDRVAYAALLEGALTDIEGASGGVVKALQKVGAPDVANGAKVQKEAVAAFKQARQEAHAGLDTLHAANVSDVTDNSWVLAVAGTVSDAAQAPSDFQRQTLYNAVKKDKKFAAVFAKACT
jgi:hypothetical protein